MTAQPVSGADHPFLDSLADAHQHAVDALAEDLPLDAVVWLSAHLAAEQLMASYDAALRQAPTRPHPHTPHRGLLGAVAFKVDALRDKVMDTMDGRHVPAPRKERRPVKSGRWGSYVLGEMQE